MSPLFPGLASSDPFQRFLLSQSLEIMDDLAANLDLEGRVTYANPAAGRLLGCRQEYLTGRYLWDIMPDGARIAEMMQAALEVGQWRGEVVCRVRQEAPIPVRLRAVLIQAKGGDVLGVVVMGWDLRPEKSMEAQLVRYERQRLLGEMAGGMAHNFNNILVGIHGHAQMLVEDSGLSEVSRRSAEAVVESAERAAELVDRLQRSAKGEQDAPEVAVDLNQVVRNCVTATEPRWRNQADARGMSIEMVLDLEARRSVDARRSSVDEVLTNLVFNAVDALPDGGRITLRTWDEKDSVCVSVGDTGVGMDADTLDRLGELFFTTKGERGHGLGLAFCYRVVDQMRGVISVQSRPGEGTLFVIRFPSGQRSEKEPRGNRILVVEDDPQIRQLVCTALNDFHVEAVEDGPSAVARFTAKPFDLVLLDLSIPGLSGSDVAREVRRLQSDVPVILMTGWDVGDTEPGALFDCVIRKPFTIHELRRKIVELLSV